MRFNAHTPRTNHLLCTFSLGLRGSKDDLPAEESSAGLVEVDDISVLSGSLDKNDLTNLGRVDELDLSSKL